MKDKHYLFLFIVIIIIAGLIVPAVVPREVNFILDGVFWSATVLLVQCVLLLAFMFQRNGGSTRLVRFCFALVLIISAVGMYGNYELVLKEVADWSAVRGRHGGFIVFIEYFLKTTKDLIGFGFAGIGASLAASAIVENRNNIYL